MDVHSRRPLVQRQRSDSTGRALSPTDSVASSIGSSHGPLLMWVFKHIRRENQDSLTKEDLRRLLDVDIDNEQLDEAFENLDMDGDGRVSLDEFLSGFARFLREAPTTPGKDIHHMLLASGGLMDPSQQRPRTSGRKRGSVRRRLVDEECYESTDNGVGRVSEVNGEPTVKPSENFDQSLGTLSSHNRHSIATLWRSLSETNPELLADFEDFVGEVAHEVEGAQRALENQRRATKQEARELDEEMESRLNAANANLQIQTALTEVKTKLKLEQRLGDKEMELSAVKQKLQELNTRLESVCNFALQLESEVQVGHQAHSQLEEQFEMLSQEKAVLECQLEAREAVLMEKHVQMERLHQQTSHTTTSHVEETQVELLEMKKEYEREISQLKEKIMTYEMVDSDDEMSLLSGRTPDLLSTLSTRHRHTSRHSLLDEIIKQEGIESPILRGELLMDSGPGSEPLGRSPWRANSLPDLFRTRHHHLEPFTPISFQISPPAHRQQKPLEGSLEVEDQITPLQSGDDMQAKQEDHVTTGVVGHVTSDGSHHMETLETPFSRSRSATVSGGGRPKRMRRPKKATPSTHVTTVTDQSHVTSRDDHMTASNDSIPSSESQVMPPSSSSTSKKTEIVEQHMTASNDSIPSSESEVMPPSSSSTTVESKKTEIVEQETGSDEEVNSQKFIIKCQPLQFIENLATQPDYVFKILVVGNSYVGKSSFLMRLCTNAFSARYSSTIGVDFYSKALKVDGRIISLQLWDTAGQERFQSVTKAYYRGAQGVILMYDISQEESFIAVKSWINSIQENVDQMPTGLMLIGNKQDLDDHNEREVSTETGETFAKIYNAQFMETSAKTGFNVGNCLMNLVRTIKIYYEQDSSERRERGIQVNNKPKGSSCCGR